MPSLVNLKTRISSVTSTQKVIKAMELVASSKIKKARIRATEIDFFQKIIIQSMNELPNYLQYNKLIKNNKNGKDLYIVITSDMGLCGPYNNNVTKFFLNEVKNSSNFETIVLGTKGVKKISYENINITKKIVNYNKEKEIDLAETILDFIKEKLKNNTLKSIKIIYTNFINPLQQEVQMIDLLDEKKLHGDSKNLKTIEIESDEKEVFNELFQQYILGTIYSSLLKSLASEHSYRRNSMDTANTNSLELIDKLHLELNRIRQSAITQEISEIIGGSESTKKE